VCPDARVTAVESDPRRADRIRENLTRLGLAAEVKVADAADTVSWRNDGQPFDAILLDAPCSASGILARHPDARWLRRPGDIAQLAARQDRLLAALWPLLAPGGRLLYCTCSVFREEGEERIRAFQECNSTARLLPSPGHVLPLKSAVPEDNTRCDSDGFYFALLERC
jgi:16S rRNA (cytosine967-C5)-methyltransferase